MPVFDSLLIANRGEIALRIMRTARRLGLSTVAVYSDADAESLHVRQADRAEHIGAAPAADSYLQITNLLAAARRSGAQAVHPGYGFLAENADFAQAVQDAGLVWVGPPPAAIRAMGDKAQAKRLMQVAGVPCVPGFDGPQQDDETLRREAARIGYPLMVKATAGGGGRGMRLVAQAADLQPALAGARSEAMAAFGSSTLLLERAITEPRHVEIQVFADGHGHVVHLGERECSVQRRHQKLIEEAPSPALGGDAGARLRRRMGDMAVAATRAIDYRGAGTVECLLDTQGRFYFMEMNTRLQVEHPVTEALTGYDLVEWQLRVAQGENLPETSQDVILRRFESGGHAIEARLCAEDPAHDFLPQSGRLLAWQPADGGVRIEHALAAGREITPYYDSMVAKFIAHAPQRDGARRQLADALGGATVLGVATNQAFLKACLEHPVFAQGAATTGFIGSHLPALLGATPPLRPALAALVLYAARARRLGHDPAGVPLPLPWPLPLRMAIGQEQHSASVQALGGNRYRVAHGAGSSDVAMLQLLACDDGRMAITADGHTEHIVYAADPVDADVLWTTRDGCQSRLHDLTLQARVSAQTQGETRIRAPMAGRVAALHVQQGQTVARGTPLLVLEAMKMEHPALAPFDALVAQVATTLGAQVPSGMVLLELRPVG